MQSLHSIDGFYQAQPVKQLPTQFINVGFVFAYLPLKVWNGPLHLLQPPSAGELQTTAPVRQGNNQLQSVRKSGGD